MTKKSKSKKPAKQRNIGTIAEWWPAVGHGSIRSDDGARVQLHQVDLVFQGNGPRNLPQHHQCEYEMCRGPDGELRACVVTRSAGRTWQFDQAEGEEPGIKNFMRYYSVVKVDDSIHTGVVKLFTAESLNACIIADEDGGEIFCDATSISKSGSYMAVRRGVKVEYRIGKSALGEKVATNVTGVKGAKITMQSRRANLVNNRRRKPAANKRKRQEGPERDAIVVEDAKDLVPPGKNPVSTIFEFASSCAPKKSPKFKLVDSKIRARCGVRTSFTYQCFVDEEKMGEGTARGKKNAKIFAAQDALGTLAKKNASFKAEIERIRASIPAPKRRKTTNHHHRNYGHHSHRRNFPTRAAPGVQQSLVTLNVAGKATATQPQLLSSFAQPGQVQAVAGSPYGMYPLANYMLMGQTQMDLQARRTPNPNHALTRALTAAAAQHALFPGAQQRNVTPSAQQNVYTTFPNYTNPLASMPQPVMPQPVMPQPDPLAAHFVSPELQAAPAPRMDSLPALRRMSQMPQPGAANNSLNLRLPIRGIRGYPPASR